MPQGNKDITDELSKEQLKELDEAISEVNNNDTIDWEDFKKEMNGKKIVVAKHFLKNTF